MTDKQKKEDRLSAYVFLGGYIVFIVLLMSMSSCGSIKNCCEKTIEEVYRYEGEYINK